MEAPALAPAAAQQRWAGPAWLEAPPAPAPAASAAAAVASTSASCSRPASAAGSGESTTDCRARRRAACARSSLCGAPAPASTGVSDEGAHTQGGPACSLQSEPGRGPARPAPSPPARAS
jgi:hypothetical protein